MFWYLLALKFSHTFHFKTFFLILSQDVARDVMLSVSIQSGIMLSVMAPECDIKIL